MNQALEPLGNKAPVSMPFSTCIHIEMTEYILDHFNTALQLICCDIPEINQVNKIWLSKIHKLVNSFSMLSLMCPSPPSAILNISQNLL